tara:strand:- start:2084 stop:3784 length:1701 start_codon:yes stop_codon:yes gene_type:complete
MNPLSLPSGLVKAAQNKAAKIANTSEKQESLNSANKFKINGTDYYCYFEISNSEVPENEIDPSDTDPTNKIRLTKSAIIDLDIQENIFEPFCAGSITINNPFDYIEDNHYTTGDGNDYLHIKLAEWSEYQIDPTSALSYSFVITDEGNSVSKTDRSNNFKSYKLIDKNFYKLSEQVPYGKKYPTEAMIKDGNTTVGAAIKQMLIDVLGEEVIGDPWDNGDHEIGAPSGEFAAASEFITIPMNWRYSDLLKYLLRINYSLGGEGQSLPVQSLLIYNRDKQTYTLEPIDLIFKDNEILAIEGFGLGDLTAGAEGDTGSLGELDTNKNNPKDSKVPVNENEGMLKNANITTPMVNYGNQYFTNYSAGFYNPIGGTQGQHQVSIEEIAPEWAKSFVDIFKLVGGKPQSFVPVNKIRSTTIKPFQFPFQKEQIVNIAKAQMVSNLTFLNLQLSIDNQGDTNRQPGRFIDIFKLVGGLAAKESYSDGKMLGRWFVTKVHHRFFKDSYQNVMQCVKTYVGPDIDQRFDDASLGDDPLKGKQIKKYDNIGNPADKKESFDKGLTRPGGDIQVLT